MKTSSFPVHLCLTRAPITPLIWGILSWLLSMLFITAVPTTYQNTRGCYYMCSSILTPFFRSLEILYSFDPYILAKMRKMLYFDPYFSSKLSKMYSFDPPFFYPCSVSSRRPVRSIPTRYLTEYPPTPHPGLSDWVLSPSIEVSGLSEQIYPFVNRNHQQYSQYLVVQSGTVKLSPGQGTKPDFRQWKIKENQNIQIKLALKQYDDFKHVTHEYN